MGTRGLIGIQNEGKIHGCFNSHDSYPSYLGQWMANAIGKGSASSSYEKLKEKLKTIEWIDGPDEPKCSDVDIFLALIEDGRDTLKYRLMIPDDVSFFNDCLFCEWAYIINLDEDTLDIYSHRKTSNELPSARIKLNGRENLSENIAKEFEELIKDRDWQP
jgi:hypothetical protein